MVLKIAENGEIYDVPIREGEVFFCRLIPCMHRSGPKKVQSVSLSSLPA